MGTDSKNEDRSEQLTPEAAWGELLARINSLMPFRAGELLRRIRDDVAKHRYVGPPKGASTYGSDD